MRLVSSTRKRESEFECDSPSTFACVHILTILPGTCFLRYPWSTGVFWIRAATVAVIFSPGLEFNRIMFGGCIFLQSNYLRRKVEEFSTVFLRRNESSFSLFQIILKVFHMCFLCRRCMNLNNNCCFVHSWNLMAQLTIGSSWKNDLLEKLVSRWLYPWMGKCIFQWVW